MQSTLDLIDDMPDRRLLFVHAHPDDESLGTGATMAMYAAQGCRVALVTCTLGEEGEVVTTELAHLGSDRDDRLGEHRIVELAQATKRLGVTDPYFLGGAGRWRDSGMMGKPTNDRADCFWQADLDEAVQALVDVIEEVRPQVLVTYDENGVYGHPDHIQAYRVSAQAFDLVRDTPYRIDKLYLSTVPRSAIRASAVRTTVPPEVENVGVPDERITTVIDGRGYLTDKLDALRAHASQMSVHAPWFALPEDIARQALAFERYVLRDAPRGVRETDFFKDLDN